MTGVAKLSLLGPHRDRSGGKKDNHFVRIIRRCPPSHQSFRRYLCRRQR